MKKMLGMIMALVLLAVSMVPVAVSAADAVEITISTIEKGEGEVIAAGETFDITVSTNAIDTVSIFTFKFRYNKQMMTPVNGTASGFLTSLGQKPVNIAPANPTGGNSALYGEVWITGSSFAAVTAEAGVVATITFEAVKEINASSLIFCCEEPEVCDENYDTLTVNYVDGGIKFPTATTTTTTTTAATDEDAVAKVSLMPDAADKFTCVAGGDGTIAVSVVGDSGFKFTADKGWPNAYYMGEESEWVTVDTAADDAILYYDFTVSAGANVLVFFEGQNPGDDGAPGTYVSLNTIIDENNVDANGNVIDLAAGTYKGQVHVKDLGCDEQFITDGKFRISGMKVFAVGGSVIVNELAVVGVKGVESDTTTTTTETEETTTTSAQNDGTTTTVTKKDTAKQDSAKTGDVSNAVIFIIVAIVAAALIAVSIVMSKKKKNS